MPTLNPMHDSDVLDETITQDVIAEPPMYKVWLLNDDYTPFDFVIQVLQEVFNKPRGTATQIMLQVHHEGQGMIAIYPKDIAEDKREKVARMATEAGHPLQVRVERDDPKPQA